MTRGCGRRVNMSSRRCESSTPVKVSSRIRASNILAEVELKGEDTLQFVRTVEIEGGTKRALVADWISRTVSA